MNHFRRWRQSRRNLARPKGAYTAKNTQKSSIFHHFGLPAAQPRVPLRRAKTMLFCKRISFFYHIHATTRTGDICSTHIVMVTIYIYAIVPPPTLLYICAPCPNGQTTTTTTTTTTDRQTRRNGRARPSGTRQKGGRRRRGAGTVRPPRGAAFAICVFHAFCVPRANMRPGARSARPPGHF